MDRMFLRVSMDGMVIIYPMDTFRNILSIHIVELSL